MKNGKNVVMIVDDCATAGYCKNEQMKKTFVLTLFFSTVESRFIEVIFIEKSCFGEVLPADQKLNRDSTVM